MKEEGKTTRAIEKQTSKAPSIAYLGIAIGSIAVSAALFFSGRKNFGQFVGLWAPTILITGLYNKLVKVQEALQAPAIVPATH